MCELVAWHYICFVICCERVGEESSVHLSTFKSLYPWKWVVSDSVRFSFVSGNCCKQICNVLSLSLGTCMLSLSQKRFSLRKLQFCQFVAWHL